MEETQKIPRGEKKEFPLTTLIVAEEVAKAVNDAGGKINSKAISASLGIKGGALARKLAAAKRWGLIKGSGMLELTLLGKKIVIHADEEDLAKSRKEAFFHVPLFVNLYERFGKNLPAEQAFISILANEYKLSERDAKTMLTIYKEAIKFYLDANTEEKPKDKPQLQNPLFNPNIKTDGKLSIYISSPMGNNNFNANNKEELDLLKKKLEKLFALIEDELPTEQENNNPSGQSNNSNTNSNSS